MRTLIEVLLALAALYCGAAWAYIVGSALMLQRRGAEYDQVQVENDTFHLGLCFILSIGFLGLMLGA